jgi:hypothetical protein
LWDIALAKLPAGEQQTLRLATPGGAAPDVAELCALVAQRRDACERGRWTFEFRGRRLILRDAAAKVLAWLDKFKAVGDVAANFDPHHFALPWAGVRFVLVVSASEPSLFAPFAIPPTFLPPTSVRSVRGG